MSTNRKSKDIMLFLGAGASKPSPLDKPTMPEFLARFQEYEPFKGGLDQRNQQKFLTTYLTERWKNPDLEMW